MKNKRGPQDYFNTAFWTTIILMFIVTIGLVVVGQFDAPDEAEIATGEANTAELSALVIQPHEIPRSVLLEMFTEASVSAEEKGLALLDERIDGLFVPVYAGITDYANFHYSVLGEYTELTAAVTQRMGGEIEARMFAGFTERVDSLGATIDAQFQQTFADKLRESAIESIPSDQQAMALAAVTQTVIDDVIDRSRVTVPVASLSAIAGVSAIKVISKNMAQVVASKVAVKFAAKSVVKTGFGLGGAGTGAALGSVLGPIGSVVGGIAGAVAVYFAADAVIINIDQYFNQDEFEAELRDLVDSMRRDLYSQFRLALERKKTEIRDFTLNEL